jgi:DNA-binding LytR/AlgR family response regulator
MNIPLKVGRKIVFVNPNEINYIQSNNIYCNIYLKTGECLVCTSTLSKLELTLKSSMCVRTHRCYIVNKAAIHSIDKHNLHICLKDSTQKIPIARSRKNLSF